MGEWISKKRRTALYERDNFSCRYCGKESLENGSLSLDHVIPKSKGGNNKDDNLVTACPQCQWKKMNKDLKNLDMKLISIG